MRMSCCALVGTSILCLDTSSRARKAQEAKVMPAKGPLGVTLDLFGPFYSSENTTRCFQKDLRKSAQNIATIQQPKMQKVR